MSLLVESCNEKKTSVNDLCNLLTLLRLIKLSEMHFKDILFLKAFILVEFC